MGPAEVLPDTRPAQFAADGTLYVADTCEPLKVAAQNGDLTMSAWSHGTYPGYVAPDETLPELLTAGVWDARRAQTWGLDWHRNEGIEFTFVSRGRLPFSCHGRHWELEPGSLAVTRPWQPHRLGSPAIPASRIVWLILDVGVRHPGQSWRWPDWLLLGHDDLARLERVLQEKPQAVWQGTELARDLFEKLATVLANPASESTTTKLALVVNELLLAVLESVQVYGSGSGSGSGENHGSALGPASSRAAVEAFLARLGDDIAYPWTLTEMSQACGMGRTQFSAHCLSLTNQSPMQYLLRLRVQEAKDLLYDPSLTVTEIAHRCGFSTSQYFATTFRQVTGMSPSGYRKSAA